MLLERSGVHALLARLNARTRLRFTGLHRADPSRLLCIAVFDRENPSLRFGGRGPERPCHASVADAGERFATVAAHADISLEGHVACHGPVQSHQGVALRAPDGRVWGTLCHYDLRPRLMQAQELDLLTRIAGGLPLPLLGP